MRTTSSIPWCAPARGSGERLGRDAHPLLQLSHAHSSPGRAALIRVVLSSTLPQIFTYSAEEAAAQVEAAKSAPKEAAAAKN